ncbi:hypothetical protein U9M48_016792 [Paspalum notatum var. saurae]|uniref:TATA element modulatory factor 1 TATA binding domain-containing protein n=1 Tax=Paspalum notatum var. saurae TaxID=547442 RepID=A0AAQ3WMY6_PASNO
MAAAAVTSNGCAAAANGGPAPGCLASVYSEVQTNRLLHALPLPSVLRSSFTVVDGSGSRFTGGFDMICSGRDKIETPEQASLESIRNSLAEELVKMTEQCEKLWTEAAAVPGLRAELEALKQRHFQALELMGERDEELE